MPFGGEPDKERLRVKHKPKEAVLPSEAMREERELSKKLKPKKNRCHKCAYWGGHCTIRSVSCMSGGMSSFRRR